MTDNEALLLRLVRARFGQVPDMLEVQLAQIDQEVLERFADRLVRHPRSATYTALTVEVRQHGYDREQPCGMRWTPRGDRRS